MFVLLLFLSVVAHAAENRWVHADLLRLRSAPSADAPVVATLRIGTAVSIQATDDGWAQVDVASRPQTAMLTGWVAQDFLGPQPPQPDLLWNQAQAQAATADLVTLSWRSLRLGGGSAEQWQALAAILDDIDPTQAQIARHWGRTDATVDLAVCRNGRALYVGTTTEDGALSLVDGREADTVEAALVRARQLAGATWYTGPVPTGSGVVRGSPFAQPFLAPRHGEADGSPWASGSDPMGVGDQVVVLGPCPYPGQNGQLVATAPLDRRHSVAVPWSTVLTAHDVLSPYLMALGGLEVVELSEGQLELGSWRPQTWMSCGGEGHEGTARTLWLSDGGRVTRAVGVDAPLELSTGEDPPVSVGAASWYGLRLPDHRWRVLGTAIANWHTSEGVVVVDATDGAAELAWTVLAGWGC